MSRGETDCLVRHGIGQLWSVTSTSSLATRLYWVYHIAKKSAADHTYIKAFGLLLAI